MWHDPFPPLPFALIIIPAAVITCWWCCWMVPRLLIAEFLADHKWKLPRLRGGRWRQVRPWKFIRRRDRARRWRIRGR